MSKKGGQQNKLILTSKIGQMEYWTKLFQHRFFTALVLEIGASYYLTPSDVIFISKL